jgi:hypothetical protein
VIGSPAYAKVGPVFSRWIPGWGTQAVASGVKLSAKSKKVMVLGISVDRSVFVVLLITVFFCMVFSVLFFLLVGCCGRHRIKLLLYTWYLVSVRVVSVLFSSSYFHFEIPLSASFDEKTNIFCMRFI